MDKTPNRHDKSSLRIVFRKKRQQLTKEEQALKSEALIKILENTPEFLQSQKIAAYWPMDEEISPIPLLQYALQQGKCCYLPVLNPVEKKKLWFFRYDINDTLIPNQFGILEPVLNGKNLISARNLDLVFVPMVTFDNHGNRLGMGQGYYDNTFAFVKELAINQPILIGLAYEHQKALYLLPTEQWDVPMNGIATEEKYRVF